MGDLARLIAAVEAGTLTKSGEHWLAEMPRATWEPIVKANSGSLDAAKALHDALLPRWIFYVTNDGAFVMRPWDYHGEPPPQYVGEGDVPARCWLLAILRALEAEGR